MRESELNTDPNTRLIANKAENLIANHVDHRRFEREENPVRFNVKKTLAERCLQRPVPDVPKISSESNLDYYSANQDGEFISENHSFWNLSYYLNNLFFLLRKNFSIR